MTTMIVNYGPDDRYRVEFRLNARGDVEGRYLRSADGVGGITEWDVREPQHDDPAHVAMIAALAEVLTQYDGVHIEA